MKNKKHAVISLSGGMDSSTLLLRLLAEGYEVTALSFDYGQKHKVELERATELVRYLNKCREGIEGEFPNQLSLFFNYPPIKHQIIKLDGLSQLLNSSLVEGGSEVPEGHYAEENQRLTVVPNRNKIFSSIIQSAALSIATQNKTECKIALGIHAGDFGVYPDCRQEFRDADEQAFKLGNWDSDLVNYYTPYLHIDKFGILQDGQECCKQLGLDFDEIYKRTNTSYKPIKIASNTTGKYLASKPHPTNCHYDWYSDYKSASSVERIEAFIKLGTPDPVKYADEENGPVSWEVAKNHVEKILLTHKN
jgi:7-cyano-7-deazaguanine synthase